jgi:uncharacterized protein YjbI with pentapeptide repeats
VDHPSGRPRWRTHPILLGLLLLAALVTTLTLAPPQAHTRVDTTTQALSGWLWPTRWVWPLAAALTLAALSTPPARRRWARPARRIPVAIGVFVGLVALASLATVRRPSVGLLVVGVVAGLGLLAAWVFMVPRRIVPRVPDAVLDRLPSDRDRLEVTDANAKLRNDARTTALQALGGLAVLAGAVLGFQQLTEDRHQATATRQLTLQGQASERFTRAIDQLQSDHHEAQIGGIYGLEQIAQQAPDNRLAVTEVLVAYLHRHIPKPDKAAKLPSEDLRVRAPDVHAALIVLGRRDVQETDPRLDLGALDLRRADLRRADLRRVDLRGASLRRAGLGGAHLTDAYLGGADLRRAGLTNVDLRAAHLTAADLRQANLSGADLRCTEVRGVDLRRVDLGPVEVRCANLTDSDLRGANLIFADLRGANLTGANLTDSDLGGANLTGANLTGANLTADLGGADLTRADLTRADLTGADLTGATADPRTTWPDGFDPQGAGVRLEPISASP